MGLREGLEFEGTPEAGVVGPEEVVFMCFLGIGGCEALGGFGYRAACRARSSADFANKLGVAEEEADESAFWLELLAESGLVPAKRLASLASEADQLTAIIVASRKTIGRKHRNF